VKPAVALAGLWLAACSAGPPLPVLGQVPQFQLTSEDGRPFDSRTLAGKVWVADFIYTSCPGPCPMMSSRMRQVQTATADLPDVRLVSFTVDPAHDTPPVLAEYSRHFLAQPGRWFFLTGEQSRLNDLGLNAFHLNAVDGKFDHSTRFALVDRAGRIRGYYSFGDDDFPKRLIADTRRVERERS
jgi:protein SCO1/2